MKTESVGAVIKAFSIIIMLSEKGSLGVVDIVNAIGGSKTTVHRILQSLIETGVIAQEDSSKRYKLTYRLFELGSNVLGNSNIVQAAHNPMSSLNEVTGETVHLGVMDGISMVYLDKLDSKHTLRLASRVGKVAPLHCTSLGKVLLAWLTPAELNSKLSLLNYVALTPHTIASSSDLKQHLDLVRKQGYGVDNEENEIGVICFSVPVFDYTGYVVAAISVSIPKFRLENMEIKTIINALTIAGKETSQNLGFMHSYPLE